MTFEFEGSVKLLLGRMGHGLPRRRSAERRRVDQRRRVTFENLEDRTVLAAATSLELSASNLTPAYGQGITITASVLAATSAPRGGTVTFYANKVPIGTATLTAGPNAVAGTASITVASLAPGSNELTAIYSGTTAYKPSSSKIENTGKQIFYATNQSSFPLSQPQCVAMDSHGNIYVSGIVGVRATVLKIEPSGARSYVYQDLRPLFFSMAIDSADNIYLADAVSGQLIKVSPGGSSTVFASMRSLTGVAVDGQNNVYISGDGLLKLRPDGTQAARYNTEWITPTYITVDSRGSVFGTSSQGGLVVQFSTGGSPTNLGMAGAQGPQGLTVDNDDNLYVADTFANKILTRFPGTYDSYLSGVNAPGDVKSDGEGNLLVLDSGNSRVIQWYVGVNVTVGNAPTSVQLSTSSPSVNYGQAATIYATVSAPIGTPTGGTVEFYDNNALIGSSPLVNGMASLTTSALTVGAHNLTGRYSGAGRFDPSGSTVEAGSTRTVVDSTQISPNAIALDGQKNLYIAQSDYGRVMKVPPLGSASLVVDQLDTPTGVAVDVQGNLLVAANTLGVLKIAPNGSQSNVGADLNQPGGVAVDGAGNTYIADTNNGRVVKVTTGGVQTEVVGGLGLPYDVAVDPSGTVYVTDYFSNQVTRVRPDGSKSSIGSGLLGSIGITADAAGNVYVANTLSDRVVKITPGGVQVTIGSGMYQPWDVAVDASGNLLVADTRNNRVLQYQVGVPLSVTPIPTSLQLSASSSTLAYGQSVTLTANLTAPGGPPSSGTVTFYDGSTPIGTGSLVNGVATLNTTSLPVGARSLTASFAASGNHGSSVSPALAVSVTTAATSTLVSASSSALVYGQSFTLTATVATAASVPTGGTVTFLDAGVPIGSINLVNGTASLTTSTLAVGSHRFTASYSGVGGYLASSSSPAGVPLTVTPAPTGVSLAASSSTLALGLSQTLTATVTSPYLTPTGGTITFFDNGTAIGSAPLANGTASLTTSSLSVGSHLLTARFSGTANFQSAASGVEVNATPLTLATGMSLPFGVGIDAGGNAYVAEQAGNRLRRVAPDGTVTTMALGLAQPWGVAVDASGTVYVADSGNNRVLKYAPGAAPVPVGAGLSTPYGVAVDASGNVFIADSGNGRVVKVAAGGTQTIVAASLYTPSGVAVDGQGSVYITDTFNNQILRVRPGEAPTVLAAGLNVPDGLAVDTAGNLYIADTLNNRVVLVRPDGTRLTVASGLNIPHGVAVDSAGNLFITNSGAGRLLGLKAGVTVTVTPAVLLSIAVTPAAATIAAGRGLRFTAVGTYTDGTRDVTSTVVWTSSAPAVAGVSTAGLATGLAPGAARITASSGGISSSSDLTVTLAPTSLSLVASAATLAFGQAATLTATVTAANLTPSGGTVSFYDGSTLMGSAPLTAGMASLTTSALAVGSHVLTARFSGAGVFAASASGVEPSSTTTSFASGLAQPFGAGVDSTGNLYVSDIVFDKVYKYNPQGVRSDFISSLNDPLGIALDPAGNLLVADRNNNRVLRVSPAGVQQSVGTGLSLPSGVAVDASGNVFIADTANNRVVVVKPGGAQQTVGGGLSVPEGVAVDPFGNVYISDSGNNRVVVVRPSGQQETILSGLFHPSSIVLDAQGNLLVSDTGNNRVLRLANGGTLATLPTGLDRPQGLAVDGSGNVFVVNFGTGQVLKFQAGVPLKVTSAALVSLAVAPSLLAIEAGRTVQYTATGTYTDASTRDLTATVAWATSAPTVAGVSAAGLATGLAPGAARITASSGGISGSSDLTVTLAPTSLSLVASAATLAFGQAATLTATVTAAILNPTGGTVSFYDGPTLIGSAPLTAGTASLTTSVLAVGSHVLTARFSGAGVFAASASAVEPTSTSSTIGTGLDRPFDVAVDPSGNVLVSEFLRNQVQRIQPGGTQSVVASGLNGSWGINVDVSGNLYVADTGNSRVLRITPGGVQSTVGTGLNQPKAVAIDGSGNVYVSDSYNSRILKVAPDGQQRNVPGEYFNPYGLTVDASGNVYVADASLNRVSKTNPTGQQTFLATGLNLPNDVVVDGSGNVYILEGLNNRLLKLGADGTQSIIGTGLIDDTGLNNPRGAGFDASGNLFVADFANNRVVRFGVGVPLTVTPLALLSIDLTPSSPTVELGRTTQFTAIGTYSDGSTRDLTNLVTWSSSLATIATVSNQSGSQGLASGLSVGTATIQATLGAVSATTRLSVLAATATVAGVGISWGSSGATALETATDGLRLLASGRSVSLPWTGINALSIKLTGSRTLSPSDVLIKGMVADYGPVTITGSGTSYRITLARPISQADRVTVTIVNAGIAEFTRRLDILPGDVNDDGVVTSGDVTFANLYLGYYFVFADLNGTGAVVTTTTLRAIRALNGTSLPRLR